MRLVSSAIFILGSIAIVYQIALNASYIILLSASGWGLSKWEDASA